MGWGSGSPVGWQHFGVSLAEGTSPNPTGNGAALCVWKCPPALEWQQLCTRSRAGRVHSGVTQQINQQPPPQPCTRHPAHNPHPICSPFLMCLQQHQPGPWCLCKEQQLPSPAHPGTETPPLAACLSCCSPFPLGEFSISNELFTNDNYLWKSGEYTQLTVLRTHCHLHELPPSWVSPPSPLTQGWQGRGPVPPGSRHC